LNALPKTWQDLGDPECSILFLIGLILTMGIHPFFIPADETPL
jgi:hypothetical protein